MGFVFRIDQESHFFTNFLHGEEGIRYFGTNTWI